MHLQEPEFFWFTSYLFLKRPVLFKYWLLHPFLYKEAAKSVPTKDFFTHLRSPAKSASSISSWILRSDVMS